MSFKSFSCAVLRFDRSSLAVRVMSMPAVLDPAELYDPVAEQAYGNSQNHELLRFQLEAQEEYIFFDDSTVEEPGVARPDGRRAIGA